MIRAGRSDALVRQVVERFDRAHGGGRRPRVAVAPGRVNLIGEHTDYNGGFVLPMAIDRYVAVAFAERDDRRLRVLASDMSGVGSVDLDELRPGAHEGWIAYIAGVAWALQDAGTPVRGLDMVVRGDVPIGAGLSSSAALELAVARALCDAADADWNPVSAAVLGRKAENDYVGLACGIMDQFASAVSSDGCALLLDCRSLERESVPVPSEALVVVMDTGVRRELAGSAYNERYRRCHDALAAIRRDRPAVEALRDVEPEMLEEYRDRMDPETFRRARHVVDEVRRPVEMAAALRTGDLERAGRLMDESHESLRDLYEVSCEELDVMAEEARRHPACYGARLTGAGFGGCAVALVRRGAADDFIDSVRTAYGTRFDHPAALYRCEPSAGAHMVG